MFGGISQVCKLSHKQVALCRLIAFCNSVSGLCVSYRLSTEDLQFHQPQDPPSNIQMLHPRGSLGDTLDNVWQKGKGIIRGASLPSLLEGLTNSVEDDCVNCSTDEV